MSIPFYFWLPCPNCGKGFGGWERGGDIYKGMGSGLMTCPRSTCRGHIDDSCGIDRTYHTIVHDANPDHSFTSDNEK